MSQTAVLILILALILFAGILGWAGWLYRTRTGVHVVDSVYQSSDFPTPEFLGELDGRAGIPNDVTGVPFPTPAMDGIYESGEEQRAALESERVQEVKILQVRKRVLEQRAKELRHRPTDQNSSSDYRVKRQLELVEENLAAREAVVNASSRDHAARLNSIDAATKSQADRYWGANLRVRSRSLSGDLPHLELDTLIVPEPRDWRAARDWLVTRLPVETADVPAGDGRSPRGAGPQES